MRLRMLLAAFLPVIFFVLTDFTALPVRALSSGCAALNGISAPMIPTVGVQSYNNFTLNAGETIVITRTGDDYGYGRAMAYISSYPLLVIEGYGRVGVNSFTYRMPRRMEIAVTIFSEGMNVAHPYTIHIVCREPVNGVSAVADAAPLQETWEGSPESASYDGRIAASKADAYAVYCHEGELQVWDGVHNVKVGAMPYADIEALANPVSVPIGDNVFLGRSNNVLGIVIPGVYENLNIALDICVSGGYDTGH